MKEKRIHKSDERSLWEGNWIQRKRPNASPEQPYLGRVSIFPAPKHYNFPPNARM